jgi:hypothetical protein
MRLNPSFALMSFAVILAVQLNLYSGFFQPLYPLQSTNNSNGSLAMLDSEQKQKDDRASIFNQPDGSKASPSELALKGNTLTPELIAQRLGSQNSSQIAGFPLEEYSSEDILTTFDYLSDENLEKVLTSVNPGNLKLMFDKINSFHYPSIIERLSQQTQNYVINNTGIQVTEY